MLRGDTNALNEVAFSPNGSYAATSSRDRTARIWTSVTATSRLFSRHQGRSAEPASARRARSCSPMPRTAQRALDAGNDNGKFAGLGSDCGPGEELLPTLRKSCRHCEQRRNCVNLELAWTRAPFLPHDERPVRRRQNRSRRTAAGDGLGRRAALQILRDVGIGLPAAGDLRRSRRRATTAGSRPRLQPVAYRGRRDGQVRDHGCR